MREIVLEKYDELQWSVFAGLIFGYVVVKREAKAGKR